MADWLIQQPLMHFNSQEQLLLVHAPGCPAALAVGQIAGRIEEAVLGHTLS